MTIDKKYIVTVAEKLSFAVREKESIDLLHIYLTESDREILFNLIDDYLINNDLLEAQSKE